MGELERTRSGMFRTRRETVEAALDAIQRMAERLPDIGVVQAVREATTGLTLAQRVVFVAQLRDMTYRAERGDLPVPMPDDPADRFTSADLWRWLDEAGVLAPLQAAGYFRGYSYEQLEQMGIPVEIHPAKCSGPGCPICGDGATA
jgi:hypothetical protein